MNRRGFFKKLGKGVLGACAAAVGLKLLPDAEPSLKTKWNLIKVSMKSESSVELKSMQWMPANRESRNAQARLDEGRRR